MAKKSRKKVKAGKIATGVLCAALIVGVVGVAGWATKGFREAPTFELKNPFETRKDLRTFNFTSNKTEELTSETLVTFLNKANKQDEEVFENVLNHASTPYIEKVFKDGELGIRLGSATGTGHFDVSINEDYTFNRVRVKAVNYSKLKTDGSKTYNKELGDSEFTINGCDEIVLEGNEDVKTGYKAVTKDLKFDDDQDHLEIVGLSGRACILSIELWNA